MLRCGFVAQSCFRAKAEAVFGEFYLALFPLLPFFSHGRFISEKKSSTLTFITEQNTRETTTATTSRRTTTSFSNVLSTFTSTASNGDVVLVTATSVVAVAPDAEPTSTSGSGGGLQNGAVPIGSVSFGVPVALAGFVAGAVLLL